MKNTKSSPNNPVQDVLMEGATTSGIAAGYFPVFSKERVFGRQRVILPVHRVYSASGAHA